MGFLPIPHQSLRSHDLRNLAPPINYPEYPTNICEKTAIIQLAFLVFATLVAQVFFVAQIYALAGKSRRVLAVSVFLTIVQLTIGIVCLADPGNAPLTIPPIPVNVFKICVLNSPISSLTRTVFIVFSLACGSETLPQTH